MVNLGYIAHIHKAVVYVITLYPKNVHNILAV